MLNHTGALWQYLGSFVGYTLFAVGLIYGAYWLIRRNPNHWLMGTAFQKNSESKTKLEVTANLTLEPRKNLYIVRAGQESFLLSATLEKVECLAKLQPEADDASSMPTITEFTQHLVKNPDIETMDEKVELPWFAAERIREEEKNLRNTTKPGSGFGSRLVQSVQWLMESRGNK